MADNSTMIMNMIMGSFMMICIYGMVMIFADVGACYTLNEEVKNQELCVEGTQQIIDITNGGMIIYIISIGIGIIHIVNQERKPKPTESKQNGVFKND